MLNSVYFESGRDYNKKRGLYILREFFPLKDLLRRKSDEHYKLLLLEKWRFLKEANSVLDAGCGKGAFIKLNPYKKKTYGVDIIKEEIIKAKKNGLNVNLADLNKSLPFEDDSFDGITCSHVLEHIGDPANMLKEFRRILVKGGILVIAVPNFSFKHFYRDPTHKRPYPKEALYRLLIDYGFTDVKIKNGPHLNQLLSFVFFLFPRLRFNSEKLLGLLKPWEIIAIAKNKK